MEGHCHKVCQERVLIFGNSTYRLYDAMVKNFLTTLSNNPNRFPRDLFDNLF